MYYDSGYNLPDVYLMFDASLSVPVNSDPDSAYDHSCFNLDFFDGCDDAFTATYTEPPPPPTSHAFTILDPTMYFTSETHQHVHSTPSKHPDPYAARFIEQQLGPEKWSILSTRLSERRISRSRTYSIPDTSATAIDFLVKVEAVKDVLREYVPHPYNHLKSLTHPYQGSPLGSVTLTRSTILSISGWSNTQFSYWARRVEAIAVLGPHDARLRTIGLALERRLRGGPPTSYPPTPEAPTETSANRLSVTGKGLDVIIDDVKHRTGMSQFLRGKHSSLDPYGASAVEKRDMETVPPPPAVFNTAFQVVHYIHSPPPCASVQENLGGTQHASLPGSPNTRAQEGKRQSLIPHETSSDSARHFSGGRRRPRTSQKSSTCLVRRNATPHRIRPPYKEKYDGNKHRL